MCRNSATKKHRRQYRVGSRPNCQPTASWDTKSVASTKSAAAAKFDSSHWYGQLDRTNHFADRTNHFAEHTCPRHWSWQPTCSQCYEHAYATCMRSSWAIVAGKGHAKQYTPGLDNDSRIKGQTLSRGSLAAAGQRHSSSSSKWTGWCRSVGSQSNVTNGTSGGQASKLARHCR